MDQINSFNDNDFLNEYFPNGIYKPHFSDDDSFLNDNNNINEDFGNNRKSTNTSYQIPPSNTPLTPLESNKINFPQNNTNFFLKNPKIPSINKHKQVINNRTPRPPLQQPFSNNSYPYNIQKNLQKNNFNNRIFPQNLIIRKTPSQTPYLQKFENKKNELYNMICENIKKYELDILFRTNFNRKTEIDYLVKKEIEYIKKILDNATNITKNFFSKEFFKIIKAKNFNTNKIDISFKKHFNQYSKALIHQVLGFQTNAKNKIIEHIKNRKIRYYLQKFENKKNEFYTTIYKKINTSALNLLKSYNSNSQPLNPNSQHQILKNLTQKKLSFIETEIFIITQNFKNFFSKKFSEILKTQNFTINTINHSFNEYFSQYSNTLKNSEIKTQVNFKKEIMEYLKTKNNRVYCPYRKNLFGINIFNIFNNLNSFSNKKF